MLMYEEGKKDRQTDRQLLYRNIVTHFVYSFLMALIRCPAAVYRYCRHLFYGNSVRWFYNTRQEVTWKLVRFMAFDLS